eukprot:1704964-Rhodomonas_salina.2
MMSAMSAVDECVASSQSHAASGCWQLRTLRVGGQKLRKNPLHRLRTALPVTVHWRSISESAGLRRVAAASLSLTRSECGTANRRSPAVTVTRAVTVTGDLQVLEREHPASDLIRVVGFGMRNALLRG